MSELFYDERDDAIHEARGSQILYWLDDLEAKPITEARPGDAGFLFAGSRGIEDYEQLIGGFPGIRDRAHEREPLLQLDAVLEQLVRAGVDVPTPRTWRLELDESFPDDLTFPLFVRTARTSLKLGGQISRVHSRNELEQEAAELRRVLGWDSTILAREWCEFAKAGDATYGDVPQEVRVWLVDRVPVAWSFHHLHLVPSPKGFPPAQEDLTQLRRMAHAVGSAFESRCVVADFARLTDGNWVFLEAGPGSCAGTAHETVFKYVAGLLQGERMPIPGGAVGGAFPLSSPGI